jgi:hypothetical protein
MKIAQPARGHCGTFALKFPERFAACTDQKVGVKRRKNGRVAICAGHISVLIKGCSSAGDSRHYRVIDRTFDKVVPAANDSFHL